MSLTLFLAPFMMLAYFYAAKALFSFTDAAEFLEKGGGIVTIKLHVYKATLVGSSIFGVFCAWLIASCISAIVDGRRCENSYIVEDSNTINDA